MGPSAPGIQFLRRPVGRSRLEAVYPVEAFRSNMPPLAVGSSFREIPVIGWPGSEWAALPEPPRRGFEHEPVAPKPRPFARRVRRSCSSPNRPVFQHEARHSSEIAEIPSQQNRASRESNGCDPQVHRRHANTLCAEVCPMLGNPRSQSRVLWPRAELENADVIGVEEILHGTASASSEGQSTDRKARPQTQGLRGRPIRR